MGNHYHLLVRVSEGDLSRAIDRLERAFETRLRRRHGGEPPRFRGRFRACPVGAMRNLVLVSRYVHLNPVEAGLTSRAEDWPWSSMRGYLNPAAAPSWLRTSAVLGWFGGIGARQRYRKFVRDGLDRGARDAFGRARWGPILAGAAFVERMRAECALLDDASRGTLPETALVGRRFPLHVVARAVSVAFHLGPEALKVRPGRVTPSEALARGAFVHLARRLGAWTLPEIAGWLGYASNAGAAVAARRFARAAERDPELGRRLDGAASFLIGSRSEG